MEMEALTCKHCGASIPVENIINDGRIAICAYCDTVHNLIQEEVAFPEKSKNEKQKRSKPDKFTIERHADAIELRYRWLGKQHWALLFFTVIWDGFMVFWVGAALASGAYEMILFGSIHLLIGIGLAYYVLTGFINKTSIMIRNKGLDIKHRPMPFFGAKDTFIDRRAIEQVYCTRRVAYTSNNSPVYVFDVRFLEKGGEDSVLVKGLDTLHKAIYVEQQIEHLYRIDDEPVDSEYGR